MGNGGKGRKEGGDTGEARGTGEFSDFKRGRAFATETIWRNVFLGRGGSTRGAGVIPCPFVSKNTQSPGVLGVS